MSLPGWVMTESRDALSSSRMRMYTHRTGFRLVLLPRPGYARRFGSVCVPYGSIHGEWQDARGFASLPAGTAHYLEHCVFSKEAEESLLLRLAALGAEANAYTSHTHTMYYFTAVEGFEEALFAYFDAVTAPILDQARVEAERGIILSEIDMYADDPDSRAYTTLLESMYSRHPVRIDIAGTTESVARITAADLQRVADHFYRPSSLMVTVVGDVDEHHILSALDQRMETTTPILPKGKAHVESPAISQTEVALHMDVGTDSFLVGFKDPLVLPATPWEGLPLVERKLTGRLLAESLIGPSSYAYQAMYEQGVLNDTFEFQYICEHDFAYLIAGGETSKPRQAAAMLIEALQKAMREPLDPDLFDMQKRVASGQFLRSMDHVRACGMAVARSLLDRVDFFDYPTVYDRINAQQAMESMRFLADPANAARVYVTHRFEEGRS